MKIFAKIKNVLVKEYMKFISKKSETADKMHMYKSNTTKRIITSDCTMNLDSATEAKKAEINEKLKTLVKKYIDSPEQLIQYIRARGISLYKINNASKILESIGEEEGFITPLKGFKAFYINFILGLSNRQLNLNFQTKAMFIFNVNNTEIYTIARALHKYYGYINNLPGFDYESQEIFRKIYSSGKSKSLMISKCSVQEIYACKEAIARDLESINFTIELSKEYERAQKALKKIKDSNSANI